MRERLHKVLGQIGSELRFHATDSSHRVIVGENLVSTLAPPNWFGSSSFLQVTRTTIKAWMGLKFSKIGPWSAAVATL